LIAQLAVHYSDFAVNKKKSFWVLHEVFC